MNRNNCRNPLFGGRFSEKKGLQFSFLKYNLGKYILEQVSNIASEEWERKAEEVFYAKCSCMHGSGTNKRKTRTWRL